MSWKPNETEIIDYLYGDLAPDLQKKFTNYMQSNKAFAQEVKDLQQVEGLLPSLPDEEVILPLQFSTVTSAEKRPELGSKWLYPVSIAASIAAILMVGYFTQFSISYGDEGFKMAFNDTVPVPEASLSEDDINTLIDSRVNRAATQWQNQADEMQLSFTAQLAQNKQITEKKIRRVANSKTKVRIEDEQILAFISQLKDENRKIMQTFYQVSADEQQKYMRNILLDFQNYLDNRRQEDLQVIQANLLELQSTSALKQEETDKILASIITTVNQNSLGQ